MNPLAMEADIMSHGSVQSASILAGKTKVILLIELVDGCQEVSVEEIWPAVLNANDMCPVRVWEG